MDTTTPTAQIPIPIDELIQRIAEYQQKDKLYSPSEACKMFVPAISKPTLSKWTDEGLLPVSRLGGRLFYRHADLLTAGSNRKKYSRNN